MVTITRKPKKESGTEPSHHPVRQAIGWQMQVSAKVWSPPTDMYETEDAYIWSPPTDMYETEDAYIVRIEIAGMGEADFTVSVEENFLIISGSRPDIQERRAYHQMEIRCGRFTSAVSLPNPIDLENASAEYEDGFFVVVLPKLKSSKIDGFGKTTPIFWSF